MLSWFKVTFLQYSLQEAPHGTITKRRAVTMRISSSYSGRFGDAQQQSVSGQEHVGRDLEVGGGRTCNRMSSHALLR